MHDCKIKMNDCKIKINSCKMEIDNCKIKVNNVEAVCCVDKPRFEGRGSKNKVLEIFIKIFFELKIHLV